MIHLRGVMARPQASWAVSQAAAVQARSLLSDTEDRLQQALSSSMVADEVMAAMQGQVAQARGAAAGAFHRRCGRQHTLALLRVVTPPPSLPTLGGSSTTSPPQNASALETPVSAVPGTPDAIFMLVG